MHDTQPWLCNSAHRDETETVVRRYFATVGDLASVADDLDRVLADDFVAVEHPNAVCPAGAERDRAATLAGFERGKALLREQAIDVHEVLVSGDRAAVRSTWTGVVDVAAGPYEAGQRLTCEMAGFVTVVGPRVVRHETFDCYPPA